jgi:hypothetical protein
VQELLFIDDYEVDQLESEKAQWAVDQAIF